MSAEIYDHTAGKLSDLDMEVVRQVPPGGNWRNLPADFASKRIAQIRRSAAEGKGSRSTYYGRLSSDRPSYTISTYFNRPGNGCFIHPVAPRLISIREAARLQGFPDSHRFTGRGRARFIQVGNAVPPILAFQIARALGATGRFLDLFSGAGGLSLGFKWAGYDLIAAVDNDPSCIATLVANGVEPQRALQRDLSVPREFDAMLDEAAGLNDSEDVEFLVGGPPCQGFSTAGKNRMGDPRNRFIKTFLDAVVALKPRVVLMENVPALTFKRRRSTLDHLLAKLRGHGYTVDAAILHTEAYGVPQLRRRLFVQAVLGDEVRWPAPRCEFVYPHQLSMQPGAVNNELQPGPPTVANAIGDLPIDTTVDPDVPMSYVGEAASPLQRWARGNLSTATFLPDAGVVKVITKPALEAA
ncbi:MAG TPA: DNA (cytosine-5-)-methyltransferase [Solirubrobacterales bacterium]